MVNKISSKLIPWVLLILALPWVFELLFLVVPPRRLSLVNFVRPSFDEYLASSAAIFFFLLLTYFAARVFSRIRIPFESSSFFLASRGILKCCTLLLPFVTILDLYFLYSSLKIGFTAALLAFRFNELPIGYFGYFILYYYPAILAVTWSRNKVLFNLFCLVLIIFTNLLTGFRTLLISSVLIIIIYNIDTFSKLSRSIKLSLILGSIILFLAYGGFRASLELGGAISSDIDGTFIDSFNRSYPISYMALSFRGEVSATFINFVDLFTGPFSVLLQKADGTYDMEDATIIAERLVRPYLIWRGTPGALATGFSIHIVPFSYLFFGLFGLVGFAMLIGTSLGLGIKLSRFQGVLPRLIGSTLIVFVISCSESFVSAYGSLLYRSVLLLPLVLFSAASSRFAQR